MSLAWLRYAWQHRHTYLCCHAGPVFLYTCCLLRVPIAHHLVLEVAVEEISGGQAKALLWACPGRASNPPEHHW